MFSVASLTESYCLKTTQRSMNPVDIKCAVKQKSENRHTLSQRKPHCATAKVMISLRHGEVGLLVARLLMSQQHASVFLLTKVYVLPH